VPAWRYYSPGINARLVTGSGNPTGLRPVVRRIARTVSRSTVPSTSRFGSTPPNGPSVAICCISPMSISRIRGRSSSTDKASVAPSSLQHAARRERLPRLPLIDRLGVAPAGAPSSLKAKSYRLSSLYAATIPEGDTLHQCRASSYGSSLTLPWP